MQLGSGVLTDGAGPGVYSSLAEVFASYGTVYLSVQVGSEVRPVRARVATPEERERLWPKAVSFYKPYASYQERTSRER